MPPDDDADRAFPDHHAPIAWERHGVNTIRPVVVLAQGFTGHGIARSLGRLGVPVYGVHARPRSPVAWSRYWRDNWRWDFAAQPVDASVDRLLRLARAIGSRPVLLPTDDTTCLVVADQADALRDAFLFPDQPAGLADTLSSKQGMHVMCKQHGVPTPETVFPRCRNDVLAFLSVATFPVVVKGIDGAALQRRAGARVAIVNDAQTLLERYDAWETPDSPNLMLQEHIPGPSESVWMFNGYFDRDSHCRFGLTGHKIRQYPAYVGVTSLGVCAANDAVARQTIDFMRAIGYRGILDIGYKFDQRSGEYKLLDVNPRIGTTFRLFVDTAGMDVARALYLDLTGQPIPAGRPREGRRWINEAFDIVSAPRYWRDGASSLGHWARSYRGVEEASWFAWDDPIPLGMVGLASLGRVAAASGRALARRRATPARHIRRLVARERPRRSSEPPRPASSGKRAPPPTR